MRFEAVPWAILAGLVIAVVKYRMVGRSALDIMISSGDFRYRDMVRLVWGASFWAGALAMVVVWLPIHFPALLRFAGITVAGLLFFNPVL